MVHMLCGTSSVKTRLWHCKMKERVTALTWRAQWVRECDVASSHIIDDSCIVYDGMGWDMAHQMCKSTSHIMYTALTWGAGGARV